MTSNVGCSPNLREGELGSTVFRGGLGENAELRVSVTWHSGVKAGTDGKHKGRESNKIKQEPPGGEKKSCSN